MKKLIFILMVVFMCVMSVSINPPIVAHGLNEKVLINEAQEVNPSAIGDTISETFPDPNLAQVIADNVSSGDVNAVLTQEMVDSLTSLFANDLQISDLTGIGHLTSLSMLVLNNNELASLPPEIGNMSSLSFLNVSNNQLTSLPKEIGKLSSLTVFNLSNNNLTSLPDEIGDLTSLVSFSANGNQLTSFPESFLTRVGMLGGLMLEGNLLPSDYEIIIQQNGNSHGHQQQDKLMVDLTANPVTIKKLSDLNALDYLSLLLLQSGKELSLAHTFRLENYVDENMQPVNINDYFSSNGNVIKSGKVYAQVRATGTGVFNNTSDNALTDGYVELNFEISNYILSFDLNGGQGTAPANQTLTEGQKAIKPTSPIRTGYTFKGWNTNIDGSGIDWAFDTMMMPANDMTLFAQWEVVPISTFTLTFDLNGGEGKTPSSQTLEAGKQMVAPSNPIRTGYTFKGWNTSSNGSGTNWNFNTMMMPANDVTLYAQWTKNDIPITGDSSNAILFSALLVLAGISMIVVSMKRYLK